MVDTFDIMTDSCCDLPFQYLKENNVNFVSMVIQLDSKEYVDDLGENFDYEWFMEQIKEGANASTSQINIGDYLETFKKRIGQQVPLIYVCFSSAMSGSYNNALTALEMVKEEEPDVKIEIVDSKAACLGEGLLVYELINKRKEGYSYEKALDWLNEYKYKLHSWVTVEDLQHLERGGRISKAAATIGGLMSIKPIITVTREGSLENVGKIRGRKHSLEKIVGETCTTIEEPEKQTILIAYAGDKESAKIVQEKLEEKVQTKAIKLLPMGPTIASHTGYGGMAIFSFGKER